MSWELNNNNDNDDDDDEVNTSKAVIPGRMVAAYCNVVTAVLPPWLRIYMFC